MGRHWGGKGLLQDCDAMMDPPAIPFSANRYQVPFHQRAMSFVLSLAITLGLLFLLITMGDFDAPGPGNGSRFTAITMRGEKKAEQKSEKKQAEKPRAATAKIEPEQVRAPRPVVQRVILPTKNTLKLPEGFIEMSRTDLARADIGKMPTAPAPATGSESAEASAGGSGRAGGDGPGGARLYNAEWYREPTRAELSTYLPTGGIAGQWGIIACRTIDNYHVEDCRELDESPRGSGLARALRQAAWQFLIRPPRINGKPMLGTWVRIRFDFTKAKTPQDAG